MKKVIAVVGLGLIGGSLAAALKGFEDYEIVGVVRRQETLDYAVAHGVCDRATTDPASVLGEADVTFLCTSPSVIVSYMKEYKDTFKPGSLVTRCVRHQDCGYEGVSGAAAGGGLYRVPPHGGHGVLRH